MAGPSAGERPSPAAPASARPHARATRVITIIVASVWLLAVVGAMGWIVSYTNTPGAGGEAPSHWPAESQIALDSQVPTLVMFAHPHCPCTRASLGELALLMARCRGRVSARVLFIKPAGMSDEWTQTDLWQKAAAIPGVTTGRDEDGTESRLFHSETSGQTLLYDCAGNLLFQGGITASRGHSGDNPGRSALVALLEHRQATPTRTPVFGCALFDDHSQPGGAECRP